MLSLICTTHFVFVSQLNSRNLHFTSLTAYLISQPNQHNVILITNALSFQEMLLQIKNDDKFSYFLHVWFSTWTAACLLMLFRAKNCQIRLIIMSVICTKQTSPAKFQLHTIMNAERIALSLASFTCLLDKSVPLASAAKAWEM